MSGVRRLLASEPVRAAAIALYVVVLGVLVTYGVISTEVSVAATAILSALLALVTALLTELARASVTPVPPRP